MRVSEEKNPVMWIAFMMCVLGAIFYCYEYYLRVAPAVMGEELKETYQFSEAGLGFLSACFYYAYVLMQIPVGVMMDRYGPRRILTMACFICAVGTYLFCGTNSFFISQVGRFMVGFGSAFAYVGVLKIANLWLPKKYFAMMAGLCTALGMVGAMSGEILMVSFIENLGWRETLYYAAVMGIILSIILWFFIRDEGPMMNESISMEEKTGQIKEGLKEILCSGQLWLIGIIGCFTFLSITAFAEMWAVPYLEQGCALSKHSAGFGSSLIFLGFGVGGPIWGYWSDYISSRRIPLIIGSILAAIVAYFLVATPENLSVTVLYFLLFLFGVFSSAEVIVFAVGNDVSRPSVTATAVAFINMLVMVGGAVLQPVIGLLLDHYNRLSPGHMLTTPIENYSKALLVLPVGYALAAALAFALKESYTSEVEEVEEAK